VAGKQSKDKQNSDAWVISDRSGMRFRMKDTCKEPGTGYRIGKCESDGKWNAVDHPQAHLTKHATLSGDPYPVKDARPDVDHAVSQATLDANPVLDELGNRIL